MRRLISTLLVLMAFAGFASVANADQIGCTLSPPELALIMSAHDRLRDAGVVSGFPGSTELEQSMHEKLTRAEAAVLIVRSLGWSKLPSVTDQGLPFSDISGHWAAREITLLHHEGIVRGIGGGQFGPDAPVTFPQIEIMLGRLLRVHPEVTLENADALLRDAGVDTSVPCTSNGPALRGQVILLLDRALNTRLYRRPR